MEPEKKERNRESGDAEATSAKNENNTGIESSSVDDMFCSCIMNLMTFVPCSRDGERKQREQIQNRRGIKLKNSSF